MERKHIPQSETRLTLLFALSCLGSATESQLNRFLAENGLMNYITMIMTLTDLESAGELTRTDHPLGGLLSLSADGTYMLSSFLKSIPASARALIEQQAPGYREAFERERQTPATVLKQSDGKTCLNLQIMEGKLSVLTVMLIPDACPTFIQQRWQLAAPKIYRTVAEMLDQPGETGELPENAALVPHSDSEWTLFLQSASAEPDFALAVTLPDPDLLRRWASAWPQVMPRLRGDILRLLLETMPEGPEVL